MKVRPAPALALALALTASGLADAATRARPKPKPKPPICNLIVDPRGDTPSVSPSGGTGASYDPNLDILSADVANNAEWVSGVIRLAALEPTDAMAPTGRFYMLNWGYGSNGVGQNISVAVTPTGTVFSPGATGRLDFAKREIRINARIGDLTGHPTFAKGDTLLLSASSDVALPASDADPYRVAASIPPTQSGLGDTSQATKRYPLHAPSCVKPGP